MRVCPHCGARFEDDAAFCAMDGSALEELSSPTNSALRWQPSGAGSAAASDSTFPTPPGSPIELGLEGEPEEQLTRTVLGDRYRVDERIGAGGMGLVYRATHVLIGRPLAVKLLRRRYAAQPDLAQRFAQEARVASSVKHPNVVDILDYGTTPGGSPYYVMEFLPGRSLAREIIDTGAVEPRRALAVAIQIARGLAAAHQAGVIHRDLKPDNVFVVPAESSAPEQIKILDFGIAQITGRKTRLTAAGAVVGTPEYMSPEQARGDDLDARSDIYALGIVLFELLTGQVPFGADTLVGTLTKQVFELPPPIRELNPRFASCPSIEAALARMLAKNRDERPATALDAATLLQTAAANDLESTSERREQAALAGWSQPRSDDRSRRSTIMLGSGAITTAHWDVESEGKTTGSFAAKREAEAQLPKRPSVIVADSPFGAGPVRPSRVLHVGPTAVPVGQQSAVSKTPTPAHGNPQLGKRASPGLNRRHLPILLLGLGAAIFAALVTIGFVRWWQRREQSRDPNATGMNGSWLDRRYGGSESHDPDEPRSRNPL